MSYFLMGTSVSYVLRNNKRAIANTFLTNELVEVELKRLKLGWWLLTLVLLARPSLVQSVKTPADHGFENLSDAKTKNAKKKLRRWNAHGS